MSLWCGCFKVQQQVGLQSRRVNPAAIKKKKKVLQIGFFLKRKIVFLQEMNSKPQTIKSLRAYVTS